MRLSITEENYLKAIYKLAEKDASPVSTNAISREIQTSAASVTDMIKRLSEKKLISYEKYRGVGLTSTGRDLATSLIRKHRLWEVFLVDKLNFSWEEVHDIAEELEHITSAELIIRLESYLGYPKFDPHGDPIPNAEGKFTLRVQEILTDVGFRIPSRVVGVKEHSASFLKHLNDLNIELGQKVTLLEKYAYDDSYRIEVNGSIKTISAKVAQNILVKPIS